MAERIRLSRARGFRLGPHARSVARPGLFGNPWHVGEPGHLEVATWCESFEARLRLPFGQALTAEHAVIAFDTWLAGGFFVPSAAPEVRAFARHLLQLRRLRVLEHIGRLRGCDLACWCPLDQPCHADVLLTLANPPWPLRASAAPREPTAPSPRPSPTRGEGA